MPAPKKFAFTHKPVLSEVNGKQEKFYELSLRALFLMKDLAKPLSQAAAVLLTPPERQSSIILEEFTNEAKELVNRTTKMPSPPETTAGLAQHRAEAVGTIVETLIGGQYDYQIGSLLLDSQTPPDQRTRAGFEHADVETFMDGLTVPITIQMFIGAVKANLEVFGPVGKQITAAVGKAVANVMQESNLSETQTPPGSDSKTPSSSQPVEASISIGS